MVAICDHLQPLKYSAALPYAFTEHGAIMAANVLHSKQAVRMSIAIVETFVRLRDLRPQDSNTKIFFSFLADFSNVTTTFASGAYCSWMIRSTNPGLADSRWGVRRT